MATLQDFPPILLVGVGATALLDAWLFVLGRLGVPTLGMALIGRWLGHLGRGTFAHAAIARAAPIPGERALGWIAHYAIGFGFAAVLLLWKGTAWMQHPTPGPALVVGVGTVLVPLFVMQPAMGAGFASSRTKTPARNVLRSVVNHAVFGLGLYLTALLVAQWMR
jgi:hypothetical protein